MQKMNIRLLVVVISVAFGSNFMVYSTSVVNNPKVLVSSWINGTFARNYIAPTDETLSLIWSMTVASIYYGAAFGSLFTSILAENLGRRKSLILCSLVNIIGGIFSSICVSSDHFELLIIGRVLYGLTMGVSFGVASMFITEIAPVSYRGACATSQQIFVGLADLISFGLTMPTLMGTDSLWPLAFGFPLIPAILQLVVLLFSPESPRFLYATKNDPRCSKKSICFYQGSDNADGVLTELLAETSCMDKNVAQVSVLQLIRSSRYRLPLLISLAATLSMTISCQGVMFSYSTSIFRKAGLDEDVAKYSTCALGFVNFIGGLFSLFTVEKWGRRSNLIGGFSIALIALVIMTTLLAVQEFEHVTSDAVSYCVVGVLMIYQFTCAVADSVVFFISSELFPQNARSKASTVIFTTFFTVAGTSVFLYLPLRNKVGQSISFIPYIFAFASLILFLYLKLPETKNRTIESIANGFRKVVDDERLESEIELKFDVNGDIPNETKNQETPLNIKT